MSNVEQNKTDPEENANGGKKSRTIMLFAILAATILLLVGVVIWL